MVVFVIVSQEQPVEDISMFSFPALDAEMSVLPNPVEGSFDLQGWEWDLLLDLAEVVIVVGYYLSLAGIAVGVLLFVGGLYWLQDKGKLGEFFKRQISDRRLQVFVPLYSIAWLALLSTQVRSILVELVISGLIGGFVLLLSGGALLWLRQRTGPVVTVAFVYPLGVMALFLSPIAAALVSPTAGEFMQNASTRIAIILLDSVFDVGGLNALIRETFTLDGVAYLAMWIGLLTVGGWIAGLLIESINGIRTAGTPTEKI